MKKLDKVYNLVLADVLGEDDKAERAITITTRLISEGGGRDGIMVEFAKQEYEEFRIVIENIEGKLICHVWATEESCGQDPTHSIEIERK